jgi:competence protein ComEC
LRYKVGTIVTSGLVSDTDLYKSWEQAVKNSGAKVYLAKAGDKIYADKMNLEILWPQGENGVLGVSAPKADANEDSLAVRVNFESSCAYLTGDLPKKLLEELVDRPCQVLKVSHHGSKTGTSGEVVDLVKPQIALIEVGKNNYGHPDSGVLDIFLQKGVKILRTDKEGNIEIDSDGKSFAVKN